MRSSSKTPETGRIFVTRQTTQLCGCRSACGFIYSPAEAHSMTISLVNTILSKNHGLARSNANSIGLVALVPIPISQSADTAVIFTICNLQQENPKLAAHSKMDSRLFRELGAALRMSANYIRLSAITHVGWPTGRPKTGNQLIARLRAINSRFIRFIRFFTIALVRASNVGKTRFHLMCRFNILLCFYQRERR